MKYLWLVLCISVASAQTYYDKTTIPPTGATNTVIGNKTSATAAPTYMAVGTCSTAASALKWTTNTGFGCNTSIDAATLLTGTWAAPGTIGSGTPSTGAFTTISATGQITSTLAIGTAPFAVTSTTVNPNLNAALLNGTTFAAPAAIGSGTPAAGNFTTLGTSALMSPALGITVTGADTNILASDNHNTNINTGTSTGTVTIGQNTSAPSSIVLSGPVSFQGGTAFSGASWTTVSPVFNAAAITLNDTTASGTVATEMAHSFQVPTFTSTGGASTTITNAANLYVTLPVCSGGVVCTNRWGIYSLGGIFTVGVPLQSSGGMTITGAGVNLNAGSNFATNINTGASNGAIHIGDGSGNNAIGIGNGSGVVTFASPVTMSNAAVKMTAITTGTNADTVCLKADGTLLIQAAACTISSLRFKESVKPFNGDALGTISNMEVRTFRMKKDAKPNADKNAYADQIGLIAENIAKIEPRCAIYEQDMKTPKSYRQECVIALLVAGEQELLKQNRELKARLVKLETH